MKMLDRQFVSSLCAFIVVASVVLAVVVGVVMLWGVPGAGIEMGLVALFLWRFYRGDRPDLESSPRDVSG